MGSFQKVLICEGSSVRFHHGFAVCSSEHDTLDTHDASLLGRHICSDDLGDATDARVFHRPRADAGEGLGCLEVVSEVEL